MNRKIIIGILIVILCLFNTVSSHDDDEVEKPAAKTTLKERTVSLIRFEINYISLEKGKDKLDYEIKPNQIQSLFDNSFGKWTLEFYNKSNYWKFLCHDQCELNGIQKEVLKKILGKDSKIGDIKIDLVQNKLDSFTLLKPQGDQNNFEHSKMKNNCYKVVIYPHQIETFAIDIHLCVDSQKTSAVVDKYRILLENKQLGKKNHE